ncbi:hypothetical protein E2C01_083968 [Portunus trituberculatus]|uniref:Uncharacterized protein n=1 Tax=Portunus trituberculatus TaxID=210409 RepID=A0A5B7IWK9_PORTR|nr:hypothetical protein [Portunus trituberculatus]
MSPGVRPSMQTSLSLMHQGQKCMTDTIFFQTNQCVWQQITSIEGEKKRLTSDHSNCDRTAVMEIVLQPLMAGSGGSGS